MNKVVNKKAFSLSDQIFFAQRLSLLLNSGISIVESLSMMRNIDNSLSRKKIYQIITENIERGISLNKSIKEMGLKFNDFLTMLIQNGEENGHLSEALFQAYNYLEKKNEMKQKIISSLIYPIFIVFATVLMTLFLILYIFPKIIPLLSSLNIKLPLITRIVQGLYYFLIHKGLYLGIIIIIFIMIINILIKKNKFIKYKFHLFLVSVPLIRKYVKIHKMVSVCSMGEMLLSSGKSLPDVLDLSRESSKNIVYKEVFGKIHSESMKGMSLSDSLIKYNKFFPSLLIDMCALGEKTGSLSLMLKHCTRLFEQDIDNALKRFSSLIEPILMVLMGLIVGSIALSIILPVYEITNHLSK